MVLYSLGRTEASMIFTGRVAGRLHHAAARFPLPSLPMNLVAADVSRRTCLVSRQRISADSRRRLRFRGSTLEIFFLELLGMNLRKTFNAQRPTLNVQRRMSDVERYLAGSWS